MIVKRKVGLKGQVVIPKDVREHLSIKPGSKVVFEVMDDVVTLRPEQNPETIVEEYVSIVDKKLKKRVSIEAVLEEEVLENLDLRG